MIPRGADAIRHLATRIAQDQLPRARDAYQAADLGMITSLLGLVAQDFDRAADVLCAEHAALAPILERAAARLQDSALKARIEDTLAIRPASLRISDLMARSDAMLRALIEVHGAVEDAAAAGADWAQALDGEIWRFLEVQVAAQAYEMAL